MIAKIFKKMIQAGLMTIDDVPDRWRAKVQAMLDADAAKSE